MGAWWSNWQLLASGLGFVGLALVVYGLRFDRSKGRRRCPRCWYDMSGSPVLRCPECGNEAKHERQLFRTRRSWLALLGGLVVLCGACVSSRVPEVRTHGWRGWIPLTLIIGGFEWMPESVVDLPNRPMRQLEKRLAGAWKWQVDWLAWRARRVAGDPSSATALLRAIRGSGPEALERFNAAQLSLLLDGLVRTDETHREYAFQWLSTLFQYQSKGRFSLSAPIREVARSRVHELVQAAVDVNVEPDVRMIACSFIEFAGDAAAPEIETLLAKGWVKTASPVIGLGGRPNYSYLERAVGSAVWEIALESPGVFERVCRELSGGAPEVKVWLVEGGAGAARRSADAERVLRERVSDPDPAVAKAARELFER